MTSLPPIPEPFITTLKVPVPYAFFPMNPNSTPPSKIASLFTEPKDNISLLKGLLSAQSPPQPTKEPPDMVPLGSTTLPTSNATPALQPAHPPASQNITLQLPPEYQQKALFSPPYPMATGGNPSGDIFLGVKAITGQNKVNALKAEKQLRKIRKEVLQEIAKLSAPPSTAQWLLQSATSLFHGIAVTAPLMMLLHNNTSGVKELVGQMGQSLRQLAEHVAQARPVT